MEGIEVDPEEHIEILQNLLADFLAGGVGVTLAIVFHVADAQDIEQLPPEEPLCAAVAQIGGSEGAVNAADDYGDACSV
jgi:hypothetical protein